MVINDDGSHPPRVTANGHPRDLQDLTDRAKSLVGDIDYYYYYY